MKIALYARPENPSLGLLTKELDRRALPYALNPCASHEFDVALSFGGDGTFLSAVRKIGEASLPVLGINSGRLGFMASVSLDEIPRAIDDLLAGRYTTESRTLLSVEGDIKGVAVNEFTIQKSDLSMISVALEIDGDPVATYWADGVIVSTSTGSTAYSMSVGGAILAPDCRALIISPIAPHNLNIRPLVIPETSRVSLTVQSRAEQPATATVDNQSFSVPSGSCFALTRADRQLAVIRPASGSFYHALREKLYWGADPRNG